MSEYRRIYEEGRTYFFTLVTYNRQCFLTTELARKCLREAMQMEMQRRPFHQVAIVLMPDHLHTIWELPSGDSQYSIRWNQIKANFTTMYLKQGGTESEVSIFQNRSRYRGIWQKRFWEHLCRDSSDFKRCFDYLHFNPVKHGYAKSVKEYPWSTFHKYVEQGEYEINWGSHFCSDYPECE